MDLRKLHTAIIPEIEDSLLIISVGYPVAEIAGVFEQLSELFQALGICHLLETGDQDLFRENLVRSGYTRRFFLSKSKFENNDHDRYLALGRTEAFLCAVTAGHFQLACEIAELSSESWNSEWEYEDDFCFFYFLHEIVKKTLSHDKAIGILDRFEKSLEGTESWRLEICEALLSINKKKFIDCLDGLLEEKQDVNDKQRERGIPVEFPGPLFWPNSFVSIEGLALLQIAKLMNIVIDNDFLFCPSIAKLSTTNKDYLDVVVKATLLGEKERIKNKK